MAALPKWHAPKLSENANFPKLYLYNTLTKNKELFVPNSGSTAVTWYNCGPTVYDASHMGHARTYITFDIVRRVMEKYFHFNVFYVMNITDVDDKIIVRARQAYLTKKFRESIANAAQTHAELLGAVNLHAKKFCGYGLDIPAVTDVSQIGGLVSLLSGNEEKLKSIGEKLPLYLNQLSKVKRAVETPDIALPEYFGLIEDVLAQYLDNMHGSEVTDQKIFNDLSAHWEAEYFKDMEALNVLPPDVLTRVSEYVPEVIHIVKKILENGFAYESDGSVYFDVDSFKKSGFDYAKLAPWAAGHSSLLEEGEGSLTSGTRVKRNPNDFVLWKGSKPGEPFWESPWGRGRPGWHIECSAMSSDVIGEKLDIHSGGIDLCFPHHDNEIAQTEACFKSKQWVNYFLHSGHLHIEGQKMSKSLKNFITIREALEKYTAPQIRIMFLMHSWEAVLDYKASSMQTAISAESTINNFLENVKAISRIHASKIMRNYGPIEKEFAAIIVQKEMAVHAALVDNINTPTALAELLSLISRTNIYIKNKEDGGSIPNLALLQKVFNYVSHMIDIFGVGKPSSGSSEVKKEEAILPYLEVLSSFRAKVRDMALSKSDPTAVLKECDLIRDEVLPPLGVVFEDKDDVTLIKFADPAVYANRKLEEARVKQEKEARLKEAEQKRLERLEKGKLDPREMFKTSEFSAWDEKGLPTHDAAGEEVTKSRKKKLAKEHQSQEKLHEEYKRDLAK